MALPFCFCGTPAQNKIKTSLGNFIPIPTSYNRQIRKTLGSINYSLPTVITSSKKNDTRKIKEKQIGNDELATQGKNTISRYIYI